MLQNLNTELKMNSLDKIKKEFYENGFVHIKKIFLKEEINKFFHKLIK